MSSEFETDSVDGKSKIENPSRQGVSSLIRGQGFQHYFNLFSGFYRPGIDKNTLSWFSSLNPKAPITSDLTQWTLESYDHFQIKILEPEIQTGYVMFADVADVAKNQPIRCSLPKDSGKANILKRASLW